jgi:hypothetical protein
MIQQFYTKKISSMDFPQHGEVFYFYGQALHNVIKTIIVVKFKLIKNRISNSAYDIEQQIKLSGVPKNGMPLMSFEFRNDARSLARRVTM